MKSHTLSVKLQETILLTILGVLMYVSQVIMSSLPNIEIVSFLIIITTRKFGYKALLSVYIFVICEIFTYGLSIWVINYLYIWAILCFIIILTKKIDNSFFYALIAALFGLFFGTLCSIPYFLTVGIAGGIAYIINGFLYDIIHCFGNFLLVMLLYKPITKIMNKTIKIK